MPQDKLDRDNKKSDTAAKVQKKKAEITSELKAFLEPAALCNLATVRVIEENGQQDWKTTGDPTEIALQVFAHRFGHGKLWLESDRGWKQTMEFPFDSSIKRMPVVYTQPD